MPLSTKAHVQIGTSTIGMRYEHLNNIDCMSDYKLREWKGAFGVRPIVCCEAWMMISSKASIKKLSIIHFYWALYWLRTYQIETEAARVLKTNPKSLREKVREIIRLLAGAMNKVVRYSFQFKICIFIIYVIFNHFIILD
jgi:hypothetical protein